MQTGTVSFSPRFFANELKAYSDWRDAFWRELFQNSVDAGCRNISIRFQGSSDEPEVIFSDDGPGMSQETLRDVYFQLGASTKGADDIGGFGRARMLTCFAHTSYWVRSHDYIATGCGASYQIAANPDLFTGGCEIGVRLLNSGGDIAMKERLVSFLSTCQLDCNVTVVGLPLPQGRRPVLRRDPCQPLAAIADIGPGERSGDVHALDLGQGTDYPRNPGGHCQERAHIQSRWTPAPVSGRIR